MKLPFSWLVLFLEHHLREITLASRCTMTLYERRSFLSLPTRQEKINRCFEERRMGNASRRCNDCARASEKLIARSIREKPKGFGDCDVALITVNSIFLPPFVPYGVSMTPDTALSVFYRIHNRIYLIRCGIFLFEICIF